jgi:DNA-directed RNA polymerase sigma subunit (sigma70/sigma32)
MDTRCLGLRVTGDRVTEEEGLAVNDYNCGSYANELLGDVEAALRRLNPTEAEILRLRFGIGNRMHELDEVEVRFGVPRARLQRIESRALRKLRAAALEELLRASDGSRVNGHGN